MTRMTQREQTNRLKSRAFAKALTGVCFPALLLCLGGCGSSSTSSLYENKDFHFHLKLPPNWSLPRSGKNVTNVGYVVHFTNPDGLRIVVAAPLRNLTKIPDGKVLHNTAGCLGTCTFYRIKVSGRAGVFIKTVRKGKVLEEDADINGSRNSFQLQYAAPGFNGLAGITNAEETKFLKLVKSFRVP